MLRPATLLLLVALSAAGCGTRNPLAPSLGPASDPAALGTFVVRPSDLPSLEDIAARGVPATAADRAVLGALDGPAPAEAEPAATPAVLWNRLIRELGLAAGLPPPLFARDYALVQVAISDALVAAGEVRRELPDRSVAAGAAYEVLVYLFPAASGGIAERAAAEVAADDRGLRGHAVRGWLFGRAVGALLVQHGKTDGSDAVFTGPMPSGDGIWTGVNPVLPMCGSWKTWMIQGGDEIQPEPPYPFGSSADLADVEEVWQVSLHRTADQIAIVHRWADLPPPAIWGDLLDQRIERDRLDARAAARAHAFLDMTMADAFICCWNTKYTYWTARPFQRRPGLVTVIPTPNFPSYSSGHATISAAAAEVMGELFPAEREYFRAQAEEAAISRLWGGIHFRHDNEQGLAAGRRIGARVVALMRSSGPGGALAAAR